MAERLDEKDLVTSEELIMSQIIQLDTVTQLLIEKGIISEEEFYTKLKQVQYEYQSKRAAKG